METSIFLAASGTIVVLFIGGAMNILLITAWSLWAAGFIGGFYAVFRNRGIKPFVPPGALVFIALSAFLYVKAQNGAFYQWDEFSHWGAVIKHYSSVNSLYDSSTLYFPDYPPGLALFAYFIFLPHNFSEGMSLYAGGLMVLAVLAALSVESGLIGAVLIFAIGVSSAYLFGAGIDSVLIDYILASVFAGTIAVFLSVSVKRGGIFAAAITAAPLSALVLLKAAGLGLALTAAVTVAVALLFSPGTWRQRIVAVGVLALATLVPEVVWKIVMSLAGYPSRLTNFNLITPIREIISPSSETSARIIDAFRGALHGGLPFDRIGTGFPSILLFVLIPLASAIAMSKTHSQFRQRFVVFVGLILGLLFYLYGMLATYLTNMSVGEAVNLASFARYACVYLGGMALLAAFFTFQPPISRSIALPSGGLALVVAVNLASPQMIEFLESGSVPMSSVRSNVKRLTSQYRGTISAESKVYIIWQGTSGYEYWITRYEILPSHVNNFCWWVATAPPADAPAQQCKMSVREFSSKLRAYDYVLIAHADEELIANYRAVLGDAAEGLYRIKPDGGLLKIAPSETLNIPASSQ